MKKAKKINYSVVLLSLLLSLPAFGATETYSDEYVTFKYPDIQEYRITRDKNPENNTYIYCAQNKYLWGDSVSGVSIQWFSFSPEELAVIANTGNWTEALFSDWCSFEDIRRFELLNEADELPEFCFAYSWDEEDDEQYWITNYCRILSCDIEAGTVCAVIYAGAYDEEPFFETFYETADLITSDFAETFDGRTLLEQELIYSSYIYSEQQCAYIEKAIEIAENYLNFEIASDDAITQINELQTRLDNYSSTEGGNSEVNWILVSEIGNLRYYIENSDDYNAMCRINNLKKYCHLE